VGALGGLGAGPACALAAELERHGAEARLDDVEPTLARLEGELDRLVSLVTTPDWPGPA
jgi:hypothetical protein